MTKTPYYTYLGVNGTITSPILLENIYHITKFQLRADNDKMLTKDGKTLIKSIMVSADEINDWYEVGQD